MADELDKFVLQYSVELKDSIARLEQLQEKMASTEKSAKKTKGEFKEFATGAADEFGKVVPGIDKVTAAVKALGAEFTLAASAVGILAVGIKAAMDVREQYDGQRKTGQVIGVSPVRVEEYRRALVRGSGGRLSSEQATEQVQKFREMLNSSYQDPTRLGMDSRKLKMLGINVGAPGKTPTTMNDAMVQLAKAMSAGSEAQARGLASAIGMDQDFALSMRKNGPDIGNMTQMSQKDIKSYSDTQDELAKFNDALGKMNENFKEASNILGERLLPFLTRLVEALEKVSERAPAAVDKAATTAKGDNFLTPLGIFKQMFGGGGWEGFKRRWEATKDSANPESNAKKEPKTAEDKEIAKKNQESANKFADAQDKANSTAIETANKFNLAANMFAGAVASFANAVDERQAWAAWAGEAGRAAGLGEGPMGRGKEESTVGEYSRNGAKYLDIFKEAADKFKNVSVDLLMRVAQAESTMNPNAVSEQGAKGLMQIMDENKKKLGITNSFDPRQNIMGGAQILSENLRHTGGDVRRALLMYHGGWDASNWGKKTMAYPGRVLGEADVIGGGESRYKLNLKATQANIAKRLGVPVQQLQLGAISRGDAGFAESQLEAGIQNQIFSLKNELKNPVLNRGERQRIINEIMAQQNGLNTLRQLGGDVVAAQPEGPRSITIGERAIVINVNGADDPQLTASQILDHLNDNLKDIANLSADGRKY